MLIITDNSNGSTCFNLKDEKVADKLLNLSYNVSNSELNLVKKLIGSFDNLIFAENAIFIGRHNYKILISCKSYTELYHELLPYCDEYLLVTDIRMNTTPLYGFNIWFYYPEHSHYYSTIKAYIRSSNINEILKAL